MRATLETNAPGAEGKRRRVLWLQQSLLAVLAYLTVLEDPIQGFGLDELGVITLAGLTLLISFLPIKYFAASELDCGLLLCNLSFAGIPVLLTPERPPDSSFFLIAILVVAVAAQNLTAAILAILSCTLYDWALHSSQQPQPAQILLQHLPFFFLMGFSYVLLRSLLREERRSFNPSQFPASISPSSGRPWPTPRTLRFSTPEFPALSRLHEGRRLRVGDR